MKIEKLTDNKIRIILKQDDFKDKSIDVQTIMTKPSISQDFFLELLKEVKKEIGFETDGYKLLIEGFSSSDNTMVFTITKFNKNNKNNKKPLAKKRTKQITNSKFQIFKFDSFEDFCKLSTNQIHKKTNSSLYKLQDEYYLIIKTNQNQKLLNELTEFATLYSTNPIFETKLKEFGTCIIKSNAIEKANKYF